MKIKYKDLEVSFNSSVEKMPPEIAAIFEEAKEMLEEARDRARRGLKAF